MINTEEEQPLKKHIKGEKYLISPFYKRFKEHLSIHFSKIEKLEKVAESHNIKEGEFLKRVNAIIQSNLDRENFDTATLAKAMATSRIQLYRRLKKIIGFAPSQYIRYIRLHKAKELLENCDLTVSEVAFRTGFINLSHFSKVFRKEFGFNPSDMRWKKQK